MRTEKSQTYPPEFRESSVKLTLELDQPITKTAQELGIKPSTLPAWISKYTKTVRNNKKSEQMSIYMMNY